LLLENTLMRVYRLDSYARRRIVRKMGQIGRQMGPSDASNGILKSKGRVYSFRILEEI
jgi:hypothetical protein